MEHHEGKRSIIQTELSLLATAAAVARDGTTTTNAAVGSSASQSQPAARAPDVDRDKTLHLEEEEAGVPSAAAAPISDTGSNPASCHSRTLSSNPASTHSRSTRAERLPNFVLDESIIKGELSHLETTAGTNSAAAASHPETTTKDAHIAYLDRVNGSLDSIKAEIDAGIIPNGICANRNDPGIQHSPFVMVGAFAVYGREGLEENDDEERAYRSQPRQQPIHSQQSLGEPLHEAGLLVAEPVHGHEHLPRATPEHVEDASDGETASKRWNPRNGSYSLALPFSILVIIIVIILAAVLGSKSSKNNESSLDPTSNPSAMERISWWMPDYTKDAIENDPFSPQALAYNWTVGDPNLEEYPDWRVRQRFALATFYYATGGLHHWDNDDGWLSYHHHECFWYSYTSFNTSALVASELPYFPELVARYEELTGDPYNLQNPCHEDPNNPVIPKGGGRYQIISFIINGLQGTLPRELFLLDTLKSIVIFDDVQAELTADIQNLPNLISLALPASTGTIPSEVGLLSNLIMLTFVPLVGGADDPQSEFTGSLPTELGNLSNLMHFTMERNSITGPIPSEMGRLSDLLEFIIFESGK